MPSDRPLVVAVRADRLGDVSAFPAFARLVERGLYLLGPMGEDDLRAAIEGPAHRAGLLLEPGLVDLLVREVEGEPGALPLLSHALRQTWERREGRTLTVAGYRATGGVRGRVAQSAEAVYERLSPEQRPLLQDLFLRLVVDGGDGAPIRGRVPRRSLVDRRRAEQLIELLVAARLVTSDGDTVELAHEALARAWPRLRGWLDDDVEGQRIFRHLVAAAETWDAMGRPDSELYRGARLAQASAYQQADHPAERDPPRRRPHVDRAAVPRRQPHVGPPGEASHSCAADPRHRSCRAAGGGRRVPRVLAIRQGAGLIGRRRRRRPPRRLPCRSTPTTSSCRSCSPPKPSTSTIPPTPDPVRSQRCRGTRRWSGRRPPSRSPPWP